jgi:hypothetical protein
LPPSLKKVDAEDPASWESVEKVRWPDQKVKKKIRLTVYVTM